MTQQNQAINELKAYVRKVLNRLIEYCVIKSPRKETVRGFRPIRA